MSRAGCHFKVLHLTRSVASWPTPQWAGARLPMACHCLTSLRALKNDSSTRTLQNKHRDPIGHNSGVAVLQLELGFRVQSCEKLYSALCEGILLSPLSSSSSFEIHSTSCYHHGLCKPSDGLFSHPTLLRMKLTIEQALHV
jgi:hypothetical protein